MKKVLILAALVLAGCDPAQDSANAALPAYRGKSVEMIFARWGPPQQRMRLTDGTIYYWTGTVNYHPIAPQTSTGYIGNTPFVINTPAPPQTLACRVEAHADLQGRTIGIAGSGNNGACEAFFNRLR